MVIIFMSLTAAPSDIPNIENLFHFLEGATLHTPWHSHTSFPLSLACQQCLTFQVSWLPNSTPTKLSNVLTVPWKTYLLPKTPPFMEMTCLVAFLLTLTFLAEDLAHSRYSRPRFPFSNETLTPQLLRMQPDVHYQLSTLWHCFGWRSCHFPGEAWFQRLTKVEIQRLCPCSPTQDNSDETPTLQDPTQNQLRPSFIGTWQLIFSLCLDLLPFTPSHRCWC